MAKMRLSISSLALKNEPFSEALARLRTMPIRGIEIAPTLHFPDPIGSSRVERQAFRAQIESAGLEIVGMQSLFFGKNFQLFGPSRGEHREHLIRMAELNRDLGGKIMVWGSFRNRQRGGLPLDEANDIAEVFFREISSPLADLGQTICIEPVSAKYGSDYLRTHAETLELVKKIDRNSVRVNFDLGSLLWEGENLSFFEAQPYIGHVHLNNPGMKAPAPNLREHRQLKNIMAVHYPGWASFEFLTEGSWWEEIRFGLDLYA